jgi:transcriptional regulator with XRE-family HTH domain
VVQVTNQRVGMRIRMHRERRALSLRQLASRIGIGATPDLVLAWERGEHVPLNALWRVADALNLSINDLIKR